MDQSNLAKKQFVPNLKLREERERHGWTYKDVAEKIGLPDSHTVGRWERGASFPSPHYCQALCRLFDKSQKELNLLPFHKDKTAHTAVDVYEQASVVPSKSRTRFMQPPPRFTSFVGREHELTEICELLLHPSVYWLTLLGTGGIGKTSSTQDERLLCQWCLFCCVGWTP